jgi:hypothetical protein
MIHVNQFMGVFTLFFLFFLKELLIGPSPMFLEHWALPNISTSLDRQSQNINKCVPRGPPFKFIYMRAQLWASHMG